MDAALGLATALFTGASVTPAAAEALRRSLQGIEALRCTFLYSASPCLLLGLHPDVSGRLQASSHGIHAGCISLTRQGSICSTFLFWRQAG